MTRQAWAERPIHRFDTGPDGFFRVILTGGGNRLTLDLT